MSSEARQLVRVLLAEDHTIVRQGLRALLSYHADIEVVGEASDGREAVTKALELQPDVVVMDLAMPGLNGVDATEQIRRALPTTEVLVLSMYAGEDYVRPAIRAGANGFLLKGADLADLVSAIRAVARGEAFFSPAVARILISDSRARAPADDDLPPAAELTSREREIVQMIAEGKSGPEIARLLGISAKTVEGHRSRVMAKLHIHSLAGLVHYAIRKGLAPLDG